MTLILRSDLPIKYYFNLHNDPNLEDEFSILFDIIQYLNKVIQAKGKASSLENFKFTSSSLKYVFGDNIKDETFKEKVVKSIKTLISNEYLSIDGETIKITQKAITNFYLIE